MPVFIDTRSWHRLDGLNKHLAPWDSQYYMSEFRSLCIKEKMNELKWPARDYIVQVARFDPSKGIPNVIDSYSRLRKLLKNANRTEEEIPQLLICGHGAVDDPDASIIYDQVMNLIASDDYKQYSKDIVVMRIPPSDQRAFFFGFVVINSLINRDHSPECPYGERQDCSPAFVARRVRSQGIRGAPRWHTRRCFSHWWYTPPDRARQVRIPD